MREPDERSRRARDARSPASGAGLGANAPIPPVLAPRSPSKMRLWSCADERGTQSVPSARTKYDASSPTRNSSRTRRSPAAPKRRSTMAIRHRALSGFSILGDHDALAGCKTVGLEHERVPEIAGMRLASSAAAAESQTRNGAVGTPCRSMNAFANALLDSSAAAALVGPTMGRPSAANRSTTPRLSGNSGPTTVQIDRLVAPRQPATTRGCRQPPGNAATAGDAGVSGGTEHFGDAPLAARASKPLHARAHRRQRREFSLNRG